MSAGWIGVTPQSPCPACDRGDWCAWNPDRTLLKCERAATAPAGFDLVKTKDGGALFRSSDARRDGPSGPRREDRDRGSASRSETRDWAAEARKFEAALTPSRIEELARELGVLADSLRELGTGWASLADLRRLHASGKQWGEDFPDGAFTFPERDGTGKVIGICLRPADGRKGYPRGGARGLIYRMPLEESNGPIFIPEGATDVAALLTVGHTAVGRPSNSGGVAPLSELLRGREVVVLGERDEKPNGHWPGREGAVSVATRLARSWRRPISWTLPPESAKDVRSWLQARIAAGLDLGDEAGRSAAGAELLETLRNSAQEVLPPVTIRLKQHQYGRHIGTLAIGEVAEELSGDDVIFTGRLLIAEADDRAAWIEQAVESCQARASWIGDHESARNRIRELLDEAVHEVAAKELAEAGDDVRSVADAILGCLKDADLFQGADDGRAYITLQASTTWRTFRVRSRGTEAAVRRGYYAETGHAPAAEAVSAAINLLEARALFEGRLRTVAVRVGHASDGAVWVDLASEGSEYVRVTAAGWEVRTAGPDDEVRFVRPGGLQPLPAPEPGGKLVELRELLNVGDQGWALASAWIVYALWRKPFPVLVVRGTKGTGKSTFCRMLRRLIDPNVADLRSKPREERDLVIAAANSRIVALENLSGITVELSDWLCRLATGAGFGTRELYTDGEETLFGGAAPVMVNGIGVLATRDDLLDRSLLLKLEPITEEDRRQENLMWARYEELRPRMLGALLDALSGAMRRLPHVQLARLPRMADFALFAVAAEPDLGLKEGEFLAAYEASRESAAETALAESLIAEPLVALARKHREWVGATKELLVELVKLAGDAAVKQRGWPATPQALRSALDRVADELRAWHGVEIVRSWEGRGKEKRRVVRVSIGESQGPGPAGPRDEPPEGSERRGDDGDDAGGPSRKKPFGEHASEDATPSGGPENGGGDVRGPAAEGFALSGPHGIVPIVPIVHARAEPAFSGLSGRIPAALNGNHPFSASSPGSSPFAGGDDAGTMVGTMRPGDRPHLIPTAEPREGEFGGGAERPQEVVDHLEDGERNSTDGTGLGGFPVSPDDDDCDPDEVIV